MSLVAASLAMILSATVIAWTLARLCSGTFNPREDLPLDLCNLTALIAPLQVVSGSAPLATWLVCVGGPSGLVSIATPDLEERHDAATRAKFWVVHVGLAVQACVFAALGAPGGAMALGVVFAGGAMLILAAFLVNLRLSSNYLFLRSKPLTPSLLDWYGDWPAYLIPMLLTATAIVILTFLGWTLAWR